MSVSRAENGRLLPGSVLASRSKHRDRINHHFLRAFSTHFKLHGETAIEELFRDDKKAYLQIAVSLLPKEIKLEKTTRHLYELNDAELLAIIAQSRAVRFNLDQQESEPPASDPVHSAH